MELALVLLVIISFLFQNIGPHETEGRYLVNHINSEENRCKDSENYFYTDKYNIYRYSLSSNENDICVQLEEEDGRISDYVVYDDSIYYVVENGTEYELFCTNWKTNETETVLTRDELPQFNGGNELEDTDYFCVDAYKDYLFFAISGEYEYMCSIAGDVLTDSIYLNDLFEADDRSGEIQRIIYDGIIIERGVVSEGEYDIRSIRDEHGYKILYIGEDNSKKVDERMVHFRWNRDLEEHQYQLDGENLWNGIAVLRDGMFSHAAIYEQFLTAEDRKIRGLISVSRHWAVYWDLYQADLDREVLFELDTETGKSRKLYATRNNLTKIIGYQDGILYLVKKEKVYKRDLETKEETVLFDLLKGYDYIIDWQSDYLIIREEFSYGQNGDIVMVYHL